MKLSNLEGLITVKVKIIKKIRQKLVKRLIFQAFLVRFSL